MRLRAGPIDPVLEPVVQAAALRGERLVSISRAVFCTLVLARFLSLPQAHTPAPYVLNLSALGVAIGYSAWILWRMRSGRVSFGHLALSVAVDAVGCFASLLQTVLWPGSESYRGLLSTPDIAALLVIVYCAGFRVWPRLALLGAILNLISYLALVTLELSLRGSDLGYGAAQVAMFLFVLGCVIVLSVGTARRTLALVSAGASATVQVDRARRKLAELVREHHDARSAISAAAISSDLIVRALERSPGAERSARDMRRHAERLRGDLEAARKQLAELGEKAYLELTALGEPERVQTARTLSEAIATLELKFPELRIEAELSQAPDLMLVGGAASLQRIAYNLVSNAREGNGRVGATQVGVRARAEGDAVELVFEDDGPGFEAPGGVAGSTKPGGMGLGLLMTSELVRVSGGTLAMTNRPEGGAELRLRLPAAATRAA